MAAHFSVISTDGIFTVVSAPVQGLDMKWYREFRVEERDANGKFIGYRGFYTTLEKAIEHFESLSPAYTER